MFTNPCSINGLLYNPPPCRQARQGVFDPVSGGLIVGICLFLRGPQPVTRVTRVPVFEHFFAPFFQTSFFTTTGAKRCQTGSLKRAQNRTNLEK